MFRAVVRRMGMIPAALAAFVLLGGCEALLDTSSLSERSGEDGGRADATTGNGSESDATAGSLRMEGAASPEDARSSDVFAESVKDATSGDQASPAGDAMSAAAEPCLGYLPPPPHDRPGSRA